MEEERHQRPWLEGVVAELEVERHQRPGLEGVVAELEVERRQRPGLEGVVAELGAGKGQHGVPRQGAAEAEPGPVGAQHRAPVVAQEGAPKLEVVQKMLVAWLEASPGE